MSKLKKVLIVLSIVVIVLIAIIIFFMNYDIKVVKETSEEYKKMYDICSMDFYKKNHLIVKEIGFDSYDEKDDKKGRYIFDTTYAVDDKGDLVKVSQCYDYNIDKNYTWYRYKGSQYVLYEGESEIQKVDIKDRVIDVDGDVKYMPNLKNFENYKPQFENRYKNADDTNENTYIDVYRLYLIEDSYYKNNLSKYVKKNDKVYLKVGINNMNLITSLSITKDVTGEDICEPMMYEYYHDKYYDLSFFYNYIENTKEN